MSKFYLPFIASIIIAVQGNAQKSIPQQIQAGPATVVNFTQLADYQLAHPPKKQKPHLVEQGEDKEKDARFVPQAVPSNATVFNVQLPKGQMRTSSPSPVITFNGTLDGGVLIPPDINGAVGPTYIVESTNQQYDIYTKTGTLKKTLQITSFFASTGGSGYFDPHVLYDGVRDRFILCCDGYLNNNASSGLFIAVSQTSDPTGNWNVSSFNATGTSGDFLDYPLLGYNNKWIVITGNDYANGGGVNGEVYVFNRASLYAGSAFTVKTFTIANSQGYCPVATADTTTANEYVVTDWNGDSTNAGYVGIYNINGNVGTPALSGVKIIGVNQPWNDNGSLAYGATQLGDPDLIESGDSRIENAMNINGSLWFSHTVYIPAANPTYSAIDWWQVNPTNYSVQQFGRIQDNTGASFYYYPGMAVNSSGDVLIGYTASSPSMYASGEYSYRQSTDPVNTMESGYIYKPGLGSYYKTFGGSRNRWGDYTYSTVDPSDNSFWSFGEFANSPSSNWGTVIVNINGVPTQSPAASFTANVTTSCTGVISFTDLSTNSPSSWLWNFGDGTTSTQENPTHTYTTSGSYTVSLVATNSVGSGSSTLSTKIVINLPTPPTVAGDSSCIPKSFTLIATGSGTPYWYTAAAGGTDIAAGDTFHTPVISSTTTYYVDEETRQTETGSEPNDSIGGVGVFNAAYYRSEIFNALQPFTLLSVKVYASGAGTRTFELQDSAGNDLHDTTINVANGTQIVNVNMPVPKGNNLEFGVMPAANLYRNTGGAVYPITLANIFTITNNNAAAAGYYYFTYDWKVQTSGCASTRVPATVKVSSVGITVTPTGPLSLCQGQSVTLQSSSLNGNSWSNGGDTTAVDVITQTGNYYSEVNVPACGNIQSNTVNVNVHAIPVAGFYSSVNGIIASFTSTSSGATTWQWNFGDGNTSNQPSPVHLYQPIDSTYIVTLIVSNGSCSDTIQEPVSILNTGFQNVPTGNLELYPNPTSGELIIKNYVPHPGDYILFNDVIGRIVIQESAVTKKEIDISSLTPGVYIARLRTGDGKILIGKVIKE